MPPLNLPHVVVERRKAAPHREAELWRRTVVANQRLVVLSEAGRALQVPGTPAELLARLAALPVKHVAAACLVGLRGQDGRLELAAGAAAGARARRPRPGARFPARFVKAAVRAADSAEAVFGEGFVCAPLPLFSRAAGALVLVALEGRGLTAADAEMALELGRRAGFALDRRALDEELERRRREQQLILDTVPAMIWYKDAHNKIIRVNRAAAEWYGRPADLIEGRSAYELFPERGADYHIDDLEVLRSGRPKLGIMERCVGHDGREHWLRRDLIPLKAADGSAEGVIVFAVDVTDIKRAEEALRRTERTQRDFVANVSHEFRTPVAAIKGFAETLRRGGVDDKENRLRFVRTIESHADRLDWLVQDLLNLSALGEGMVKFRPQRLAAAPFLREYLASMQPVLDRKGVTTVVEAPADLSLLADRPHLIQALDNLVGNALKHSPTRGTIRLEARPAPEGRVRLTVRDEGPGIAAEHLPRLFERFYRVEKGDGGGSPGLGLHIVKTIVEAQGGRVFCESVEGQGSAFHVELPAAA